MDRFLILLIGFVVASCRAAAAPCASPPEAVAAFVRSMPDWKLLTTEGLPADDAMLWSEKYSGMCPGYAVAKMGKGSSYYAVTMVRTRNGVLEQTAVLIHGFGNDQEIVTLWSGIVSGPSVLRRIPPGIYADLESGRDIKLSEESIVFEKLEAGAIQYYIERGRLVSFLASE